jgi:hypothetical protein
MLMGMYLKTNDYRRASLAAHEIMLQEFSENELTLSACLLSCMKYLAAHRNDPEPAPKEDSESEPEPKVR